MNKQETYKPNNIAWQEWSNPCNTICCSHASVSKRTLYLIILICGHVEPSPGPFWIWPPSCPWPCKWYWARGYRPLGSSSGERDCRPWSWGRGPGDEVLGTRSWGRGPGDEVLGTRQGWVLTWSQLETIHWTKPKQQWRKDWWKTLQPLT